MNCRHIRVLLIRYKRSQELQVRVGQYGDGKLLYSRRERVIEPRHVVAVVDGLRHWPVVRWYDVEIDILLSRYYAPLSDYYLREWEANKWRCYPRSTNAAMV